MTIFESDMEPLSKNSPVMLQLSPATRILNENPASTIYHDSVGSSEKSVIKHPSFLTLLNTCSKYTSMVKFILKEHNQRKQCLQYLQALLSFCLVNWSFIDHCPYPFFFLFNLFFSMEGENLFSEIQYCQ